MVNENVNESNELIEIRLMLGLHQNASHTEVIHLLYEIGKTDRRVFTTMLPARYKDEEWATHTWVKA
jgi:hypothetical protein